MDRSFQAGLVFFAIFVAGIVTGGFLMARWARNNQAQRIRQQQQQQQAVVAPLGPVVVRQMLNQVDLNFDQHKAANKILTESATVVRVLRSETDLALDRMQDDINKILTPDQRVKLSKLKDAHHVRLLEQREAVHRFLEQRQNDETAPASPPAAPASGGTVPLPPAAATQAQPAPPPVDTQTQSAVAPLQPAPVH